MVETLAGRPNSRINLGSKDSPDDEVYVFSRWFFLFAEVFRTIGI